MNRFTVVSQHNLRKTGKVDFAPNRPLVGEKILTNFKIMQAVMAQHPSVVIDFTRYYLQYTKGALGIYTFWYE